MSTPISGILLAMGHVELTKAETIQERSAQRDMLLDQPSREVLNILVHAHRAAAKKYLELADEYRKAGS